MLAAWLVFRYGDSCSATRLPSVSSKWAMKPCSPMLVRGSSDFPPVPRQTTEVVEAFPKLSRFGVMKHFDVLRDADLINTRSERRRRINSLNSTPIRAILERWISKYAAYWANTLLRVKESAEDANAAKKKSKSKRA